MSHSCFQMRGRLLEFEELGNNYSKRARVSFDEYHVAYESIIVLCILFELIKIKLLDCHSSVMFLIKSMSIYND